MFVRVYSKREGERVELLYNLNHITKIEVKYSVKGSDPNSHYFSLDLESALTNPNAVRFYKVHFGADSILLLADPNDKVVAAIEEIYKNAIKGPDSPSAASYYPGSDYNQ